MELDITPVYRLMLMFHGILACMRMRKLGKGQSVTFLIPKEIQERIRNCASFDSDVPLTVSSVLLWSISETWIDIEKSIPLWAVQGLRHQRQETTWHNKIANELELSLDHSDLDSFFEDEAMSLEKRYLPNRQTFGTEMRDETTGLNADRRERVDQIRARCERFQVTSLSSATLSEEQERELAPEIEQERQAEKPLEMVPRVHKLHRDVCELVNHGKLNPHGTGLQAAFQSFDCSTAGRLANLDEFGRDLLVTADFARTVMLTADSQSDAFHRHVQWILTLRNTPSVLVVLSPWEANKLRDDIARSNHVHLHVYAPRPNLSFPTLQDLKLCVLPPLPDSWTPPPPALILQLNLFAGQLYFEDVGEYRETCAFLGLSYRPNNGSTTVKVDGFVGKGALYPACRFTQSPVAFLRVVMAGIRRDCQDISKTHVGRMLAGEILTENDFI